MKDKTRKEKQEDQDRLIKWMRETNRDPDRELIRDYEKSLKGKAPKTIARYTVYAMEYAKRTWSNLIFMKPHISHGRSLRKHKIMTTDILSSIKEELRKSGTKYTLDVVKDVLKGKVQKYINKKNRVKNSTSGIIKHLFRKIGLDEYSAGDCKGGLIVSEKFIDDYFSDLNLPEEKRNGYGPNK